MRVNVAAVLRGCSDLDERAVGVVPQRQGRIPGKNSKRPPRTKEAREGERKPPEKQISPGTDLNSFSLAAQQGSPGAPQDQRTTQKGSPGAPQDHPGTIPGIPPRETRRRSPEGPENGTWRS